MDEVTLKAERGRATGKGSARRLRAAGKVPAVVYGLGGDPLSVAVPTRDLSHILHGPGGVNTLIGLDIEDGTSELVLARQVQRDPVRHALVHVDFVRVRRDTVVAAEVAIHLVGDAPGVKDGGVLDQEMFTLTVEAKPGDIPAAIEVDVNDLQIGGHVRVADLTLPRGVTTAVDGEELVAQVMVPRGLEVEEAEAEGAEAAEGEEGATETSAEDTGDAAEEASE